MRPKFQTGDYVRYTNPDDGGPLGWKGVIISDEGDECYLAEFPGWNQGHDADVDDGRSNRWYVLDDELEALDTPKEELSLARLVTTLPPLARKVLLHMQKAGSISAREALLDLDITSASLTRRICDLEEAGVNVERVRKIHPTTGKRYTRYALAA